MIVNAYLFFLAPASFAQNRLWSDGRSLIYSDILHVLIHNMPFLYRLYSDETLSTVRLHQALQQIVMKHQSLHTSLVFDKENNLLMQKIMNRVDSDNRLFRFIESTFETDEQLNNIMHDERYNPKLFDLSQGLVCRCHIVYYKQVSSNNVLTDKDLLIFNFHPTFFDRPSMDVFLHDLNQAYTTDLLSNNDITTLRYLDCKYDYSFSITIHRHFLLFRYCHRTTNANGFCKYVLA